DTWTLSLSLGRPKCLEETAQCFWQSPTEPLEADLPLQANPTEPLEADLPLQANAEIVLQEATDKGTYFGAEKPEGTLAPPGPGDPGMTGGSAH
ncbi:hypothetical protein LEMLEM_LOCUS17216, partial [Lemmus lemmus]